jgi:hypothetical protein
MSTARVFLSYSHDDQEFVGSVASALRSRGVDAWFDEQALQPGEDFLSHLRDSLQAARLVVVFVGRRFDSPWVNFEIGAALGQSKTVLPVFLSHHARESAPPVVTSLHGIEAFDQTPQQVAETIAKAIREPA